MRYLVAVLLLVACNPVTATQIHHPVQKPVFETASAPAPKLMDPISKAEPKADPVTEDDVTHAQHWLLFMITNLDENLEGAQEICAYFHQQLAMQDGGGTNIHWFNCGGADGYSLAVNDDGKVVYVVDSNHPSFRLDVLSKLFGEPELEKSPDLTEYRWTRPARESAGPDLVVTYCVPSDPENRPFVGIQFGAKKTLKSDGTTNL